MWREGQGEPGSELCQAGGGIGGHPPYRIPLSAADELRRLYEVELLNCREIAERWGIGEVTVLRALKRFRIAVRAKPLASRLVRSGALFDEAEMARLYREGYSTHELTRMFSSSPNTVLATLRRQGVRIRSKREAAFLRRDATARKHVPIQEAIGVLQECAICFSQRQLEIHHIDGCADNNQSENLLALCWEHHVFIEYLVRKAVDGRRRAARSKL